MVIGAGGMLGMSMTTALKEFELVALSRQDLDITCYSRIMHLLFKYKPEYIINCAAYTAVDKAESEPNAAYLINYRAVQMLAYAAKKIHATVIHFSTDYVFDGTANNPYKPEDDTNPINIYGKSKWLGEQALRASGVNHYTFRLSWLYAPHGKNFFKWVLENNLEEMQIVNSQTGSPTSAIDVSDFIKHIIITDPKSYGTYHFCNEGSLTWYAFAKAILKKAGIDKKIIPVDDFPTIAARPQYSVMDCTEITTIFNYKIPSQKEALQLVYRKYSSR